MSRPQAAFSASARPDPFVDQQLGTVCRGLFNLGVTAALPCPIITALNQSHPEYQDFDLVKVTTVELRYCSPADGKVHRGKQREENRRETGLKLRRGDDLVVLAHKTKPEETRKY